MIDTNDGNVNNKTLSVVAKVTDTEHYICAKILAGLDSFTISNIYFICVVMF